MAGKRTTIAPKGDKRYIRRDAKGRITESDDVGRSLAAAESLKGTTFENFDDDTTVQYDCGFGGRCVMLPGMVWCRFAAP